MSNFIEKLNQLKESGFIIKLGKIGGDDVVLITPAHMGTEWTKDNLIYRSSMWTYPDKRPVSLGLKKFFNWGEKPELAPLPESLDGSILIAKIDGSLLAVSKHNGELITRTRGTFDANVFDNGSELSILIKKYPFAFDNKLINSEQYTVIYEWVSPNNIIVLKYGDEPDIYLTAIVNHKDYSYMSQDGLDNYANKWGVKRPNQFFYSDINSMLESIKILKNQEGICLYYNKGQDILKVKSANYLMLHRFKSNLSNNNIVEIYFTWGKPTYDEFLARIEREFDFECAQMSKEMLNKLYNIIPLVENKINEAKQIGQKLFNFPRKDAALFILNNHKEISGLIFNVLNNKPVKDNKIKDMILEIMKDVAI
jgi:hypothetical protein